MPCQNVSGTQSFLLSTSTLGDDLQAASGSHPGIMSRSDDPLQRSLAAPLRSNPPSGEDLTFLRPPLVSIIQKSNSVHRKASAPSLPAITSQDDSEVVVRARTLVRQPRLQRSMSLSKALPPLPPASHASRDKSRRHEGASTSGRGTPERQNSRRKELAHPLVHSSSLQTRTSRDKPAGQKLTKPNRRKLSASSSSKTASKDSTRSRSTSTTTNNTTPAGTPSSRGGESTQSARPSNTLTSLKSANSYSSHMDDDSPTVPIFGSVSGGSFRSNIFGRSRDRGGSKGENDDDRKDGKFGSAGASSSGDATFIGGRGRGPGEFANSGLARKLSGRRRNKHSPSPHRDIVSANNSADEDPSGNPTRRGSVIGKVAQKAKSVLPLKRNSRDAKGESSKNLAVKTSPSSSSFQESPRMQMLTSPEAESSSEEDEDEENEDEQEAKKRASLNDRSRPGSSKTKSISFATSGQKPQSTRNSAGEKSPRPASSSAKKEPSPMTSPSNTGFAQAESILRPRTVPPRKTSVSEVLTTTEQVPPQSSASVTKRSNKIMELSAADLRPPDILPSSSASTPKLSPIKSPATSASLGIETKRNISTNAIETMSRSTSHSSENSVQISVTDVPERSKTAAPTVRPTTADRPSALRQASVGKINTQAKAVSSSSKPKLTPPARPKRHPPSLEPPMPDPEKSPKVEPAPPSGMYWSKAPCYGHDHTALRAHTATLIGSGIYVFGGCDAKACFNDLYVFDADSMFWSKPECAGEIPPPLRAMTTTAVGKKLFIFGGGDGPTYYNDIYILDTISFRFTKPKVVGAKPSKRRAHTACLYKNGIYVFGGGDGVRALNDVWRLDVSDITKLSWKLISAPTTSTASKSSSRPPGTTMANGLSNRDPAAFRPTARGYHTANMVGSKLIIFGGSDGVECFDDVWVFDVETLVWKPVDIKASHRRLSHTATVVGSYLFVIGGHDGVEYSSEVLLLNLVTMQWDRRKVYGMPPTGRGYHGTALHDSRLFVLGGFDGNTVFDDTYILELAVSAYYSQISHFTIDV